MRQQNFTDFLEEESQQLRLEISALNKWMEYKREWKYMKSKPSLTKEEQAVFSVGQRLPDVVRNASDPHLLVTVRSILSDGKSKEKKEASIRASVAHLERQLRDLEEDINRLSCSVYLLNTNGNAEFTAIHNELGSLLKLTESQKKSIDGILKKSLKERMWLKYMRLVVAGISNFTLDGPKYTEVLSAKLEKELEATSSLEKMALWGERKMLEIEDLNICGHLLNTNGVISKWDSDEVGDIFTVNDPSVWVKK
jgi:hypothetical protein